MVAERPPRSAVRAAIRESLADLAAGDRIVVALSGGADSLALTAGAAVVAERMGLVCDAVIVDHQLQPGSGEVAERAAEQARILGCASAQVVRVVVAHGPGSGGPEAAARAARYAALERAAGISPADGELTPRPLRRTHRRIPTEALPAAAVLLGHTRDDQAETVVLGLARGSGTRSLAGMAPVQGIHRRPLLDLPRALVARAAAEAAAEDPRLEPWIDPHNADHGFARVRVRENVIPELTAALRHGVVEALARTAALARADADALDIWADGVWADLGAVPGVPGVPRAGWAAGGAREVQRPKPSLPGGPATAAIPVGPLADLPEAVTTRIVRRLLLGAGCPAESLTAAHVWAVDDLVRTRGARAEVALPGGLRARREVDRVVVRA